MNVAAANAKVAPQGRRIQDARGRWVTLLDPYELQILRRFDVIPADVLVTVVGEVDFGLPRWQRRGYVACVATFLGCVIFLVIWKLVRGAGIDTVEYFLWPANLAVFALGAVKFWTSARRARSAHVLQVLLAHRRCPHCGYDIRALPVDPSDRVTICPECGTAWWLTPRQRA